MMDSERARFVVGGLLAAAVLGCASEPEADRQFIMTADNSAKVWVNEVPSGEIQEWKQFLTIDLPGESKVVVAVEAHNLGGPAGLVGAMVSRDRDDAVVESPAAWVCSHQQETGWQRPDYDDSKWERPAVVAPFGQGPWGDQAKLGLHQAEWVWPSNPPGEGETIFCRCRL